MARSELPRLAYGTAMAAIEKAVERKHDLAASTLVNDALIVAALAGECRLIAILAAMISSHHMAVADLDRVRSFLEQDLAHMINGILSRIEDRPPASRCH